MLDAKGFFRDFKEPCLVRNFIFDENRQSYYFEFDGYGFKITPFKDDEHYPAKLQHKDVSFTVVSPEHLEMILFAITIPNPKIVLQEWIGK